MLGIERTDDGWFAEAHYIYDPVNTLAGGIHIAGLCQGPKDIPDTVAQASAAASRVLQSLSLNKILTSIKNIPLKAIKSKIDKLSVEELR
jgi:heterodisulfide reductase subunit A